MLTLICCVTMAIASAPVSAGQPPAAAPAHPISAAIQSAWNGVKDNIKASAELMPEANYGFKPVDTVRTFGQILAHVAGANYLFCAAAKGVKSPHEEDEFEKSAKTRADIIKALDDSLTYCDAAYDALDDRKAAEITDMPFGGSKAARAAPLMQNISHLNEHYGNLVTYFRIKGIVPPSSRGQ